MDYRNLQYAVRAVADINDALRSVDLDAVERAVDTAASVAEAAWVAEATVKLPDLMVNIDDLAVKPAELVARPLTVKQQPSWLETVSSFIGTQQTSVMQFNGLLDGCQRAWDGISAATDTLGSIARAGEVLAQPVEPPFMSTMDTITNAATSVAEASRVAAAWKPALMRFSLPLESAFAAKLTVIEGTIYSAIRPEILSVADQLSQAFEIPLQDTFVDYMGTLFELDSDLYIDPELDLDTSLADESPVAAPREARPVILREVMVWLADRPLVIRILGTVVGEVAGTGTGVMIDGAAGAVIGNGVGGGLGLALGESLVVLVRRYRKRL